MKNEKFKIVDHQGTKIKSIEPIMVNGKMYDCVVSVHFKRTDAFTANNKKISNTLLPKIKKYLEKKFKSDNTIID